TGPAGPTGATGPQPSPQLVTGTLTSSATNAAAGVTVAAIADCPAGKKLLGGGGTVTTSNGASLQRVAVQASAPADADTWRVVGVVVANLTGGQTMNVQATAICTT
ncbi:MAG TPA: hypothetical protein VI006_22120, partial [Solirubrobacteraceae bacterium]